jgi:hypothetical protein
MSSPDKLIVSNGTALARKYTVAGKTAIEKAVKDLIQADAARGLVTSYVDLSDVTTMKSYGAVAIPKGDERDPKLNKRAIDKVYSGGGGRPQYLMLLGAQDVIPQILLRNPVPRDGDRDVPSDLPYACDSGFSLDIQNFIAPTRVVGRLPNVTGDKNPAHLLGLLKTAAKWTARPSSAYGSYLGVSAQVWQKSSEQSLDAVFGRHAGLKVSPPDGYRWTAAEVKALAHFINCHGAAASPYFYGQKGSAYPEAHSAAWMTGKVAEGTIMAVECCYGAELYDPALPTAQGQIGMCNTYLAGKAYAYFGSSNIAYGPAASNDQADLICQYFLRASLAGASVGRACLQARLQYVRNKNGVLTPTDLKTLGQFGVMADPSVTPVVAQPGGSLIPKSAGKKNLESLGAAVSRRDRIGRRQDLESLAGSITSFRLTEDTADSMAKGAALQKLRRFAIDHGLKNPESIQSYLVAGGDGASPKRRGLAASASRPETTPKAVHLMLEHPKKAGDESPVILIRGLEAIEYEDGMVARTFESR